MRIPYRVKRCAEFVGDSLMGAGSQVHRLPFMRYRGGKPILSVYPPLRDEPELIDIYHKACYFLPEGSIERVQIPLSFTPSFSDGANAIPCPAYLEAQGSRRKDVQIVPDGGGGLWKALLSSDFVLIWDWSALPNPETVAAKSPKLLNVDRHSYASDAWTWAGILGSLAEDHDRSNLLSDSVGKFSDFVDTLPHYEKAYVFGTGPSLDQAFDHDFSDGYRIVCNTIVNNRKLLDHIQPHFVCAGDAVYHLANNPHACTFRRDLEEALKTRALRFVTRDDFYPLFRQHHPDVAALTIAAETGAPGIHFDVTERLVYHQWPHGNVLNCLMLPIASGLADEVSLMGFDGRAPGDQFFWANSTANTYDDLKAAMHLSHPAFFSTMNYEAYAQSHSDNAEKLMQAGEVIGKQYTCLNASYIPAFKKRGSAAA